MLFKFADFINGIMIYLICEILRDWYLFFIEYLLDDLINFSERKFEDMFTLERRKDLITCWSFIHSVSILQCNLHQQVQCFMRLEENVFEILHDIFLLESIKSTKFVKEVKSFMSSSDLFHTIHKVFGEYLGYFLIASSNYEPLHHKVRK